MSNFLLAPNQVEWAWQMMANGYSQKSVAASLHVNAITVSRACKKRYGTGFPDHIELLIPPEPIWEDDDAEEEI